MRHHDMFTGRARRWASCLVFGGLLLIAPEIFAQPSLNQGGSSGGGDASPPSRSSSSASSGSSSSSSASSSRSSGSSRSSASSGRSSASRPRASAPTRAGNNSVPTRRSDMRRNRTSSDKPADVSSASSGGRSYHGDHRGDNYKPRDRHRRGHGYGYGYGGYGYRHGYGRYYGYGYPGYGYYGYGYPYRYGPFGYIPYRHGRGYVGGYSGGHYSDALGALDLDVRPEKAQIFIDGTLVGVADQYDGFPAYLWLEKGTYDVVIYKEGFETISRQYTIYPGVVLDVNDRMARGTAVKPEDLYAKSTARREERLRRNEERRRAAAEQRSGAELELHQQSGSEEDVARLLLNITPGDAAAYLDGHFLGTAGELGQLSVGLIVEPGDHMLEVVRPGYETQRVPVQIPAGDKITVDLELVPR